jgi:hypothetical protein
MAVRGRIRRNLVAVAVVVVLVAELAALPDKVFREELH